MNEKYKIGLAVSEFYPDFAKNLEEGCLQFFSEQGNHFEFQKAVVPGAVELAFTADQLFKKNQSDAVIALGVVIRGETSHFESVCRMVEQGILHVQMKWSRPVIHGVIMAENQEQARQRLSQKKHIGRSSASACFQMLKLVRDLSKRK